MFNKKFISLLILAFINTIGISLPYPVLSPMIISGAMPTLFDWSAMMTIMFVLSLYPLGQFLGSPIIGAYSDKKGSRKVVMCSMLLTSVGYLSSAIALMYSNILLLCFSRFFTGFAEGNFGVIRAEVARMYPSSKHRIKSFGYLNSSAGMGWIFGPIIGGALSNKNLHNLFSYNTPFIFGCFLGLIGIGLAAISITKEQKNEKRLKKTISNSIKEVLSYPSISLLLVCFFFITIAVDGFYEYQPAFISSFLKQGSEVITFYTSVNAASIIFSQIVFIPFLSSKKNFALIGAAILFSISMLGLINQISIVSYIIAGLGIGIIMTFAPTIISERTPQALQGTAMGLLASLRNLGDFLVCVSFGVIADVNFYLPILVIAIIMILASLNFIKYSNQQQQAFSNP